MTRSELAPFPLVTVCVPTVGRVEYLDTCLRSIERQTYRNLEILVLDNASGPEAQRVLHAFAERVQRARILRADTRVPMFPNFNRGIEAASGQYVVFFHDDDVYREEFIARHVALLERYPSAGFGGGNYDVIDGHGNVLRQNRLIRATGLVAGDVFARQLVRRGRGVFSTPSLFYRRDILTRYPFDPDIPVNWGDFAIQLRMVEECDVAMLADVLYSWRVHGENGSNMPFHSAIPLRTRVLVNYCEEFASRHPDKAGVARTLRRLAERGEARGLLWGWLAAEDPEDARRCLTLLRKRSPAVGLASALVEAFGLSWRRRRALWPKVRRIGIRLGA